MPVACAMVWAASAAMAQPQRASLTAAEAAKLLERTAQSMDAATMAVPGLAQAGAPSFEGVKQALTNLKVSPGHVGQTYAFLINMRSFLAVADSVSTPFPFPASARGQLNELRESAGRLEAYFRDLLEVKERRLRNPDRDNVQQFREANEKVAAPLAGRPRVVFLGDSVTEIWRLNEYFDGRDFINRGISGQSTGEMLGRMRADVIALRPAAVLVEGGTNDIARGVPLSTIENNLGMIADLAEFHKIKPLFAPVLPVNDYLKGANPGFERTTSRPPSHISELNRWLRELCERRHFTYVDYYTATVDSKGYLGAELSDDGLHPNAKGFRLMAPVALQAIDRAVKAQPAATGRKHRKE